MLLDSSQNVAIRPRIGAPKKGRLQKALLPFLFSAFIFKALYEKLLKMNFNQVNPFRKKNVFLKIHFRSCIRGEKKKLKNMSPFLEEVCVICQEGDTTSWYEKCLERLFKCQKGNEELFRLCHTCATKTHIDCIQQWLNASVEEHSKCVMCRQPYKLEKKQMRCKDYLRFAWFSLVQLSVWCLLGFVLGMIHSFVHDMEFHWDESILWLGYYSSTVVWSILTVGLVQVAFFNHDRIQDALRDCIWIISIPLSVSLRNKPHFFVFGLLGWLPPLAFLLEAFRNFRSTTHLTIQPL
jgi:hypothetical protein